MDASLIFLIVFLTSLGLTVVSFALGFVDLSADGLGHAHLDAGHGGDISLPHDAGAHGAHHPGVPGVSPFNLASILAFLTWFSGAGYLLTGHLSVGVLAAVGFSAGVGAVGAAVVYVFLARVLIPGQTPYLRDEDYELDGAIGRLSVGIRPGGTGELVYSQKGTRRVIGARSEDGRPIPRGAEVVIVRHEGSVAYVQTFQDLLDEQPDSRQQV